MTSPPQAVKVKKEKNSNYYVLEMAELVITACDVDKLHVNRSECQSLCHDNDTDTDLILCVALMKVRMGLDSKDCAVYAG